MATIPPAAQAAFEVVLRAVDRIPGFALVPVEVTGPDLGRALGAWLATHQKATRIVEPLDEPAWRSVVANVLDVGDEAAVMLLGPRRVAPGMAAGLSLLNQRRDTIVETLARPLLWCGPSDFLGATWERAPDFWSIRAMTTRVAIAARAPAESPLWPGVVVRDAPERLRATLDAARAHGDAALAARASVQLAEVLLAQGEYAEAAEVIDRARDEGANGDAAATLALLRARAAYAIGDEAGARASLDEAEQRAAKDRPSLGPMVAASRGNLVVRDDAAEATRAYEAALAGARAAGDKRNEAVAMADLGVARLAQGDAEGALAELEAARSALRDVGDERGEARALLHLGRTHAALFDARAAASCLEEALEMVRDQGDRRGEARVLGHVARAYLDAGDAEKAAEDAAHAVDLARACGDERLAARAEAVLAAARALLG